MAGWGRRDCLTTCRVSPARRLCLWAPQLSRPWPGSRDEAAPLSGAPGVLRRHAVPGSSLETAAVLAGGGQGGAASGEARGPSSSQTPKGGQQMWRLPPLGPRTWPPTSGQPVGGVRGLCPCRKPASSLLSSCQKHVASCLSPSPPQLSPGPGAVPGMGHAEEGTGPLPEPGCSSPDSQS